MDLYRELEKDPHCKAFLDFFQELPPWNDYPKSVITQHEPILEYAEREYENQVGTHWGQRKLAIELLEFLTLFVKTGDELVVYVGSAPGSNIRFVSQFFPGLKWHLYDPARFDQGLFGQKNIKIFTKEEGFFTEETAKKYANHDYPLLLISDIRGDMRHDGNFNEESEEIIVENNEWQRKWYEIMKPTVASLKFRLPFLNPKNRDPEKSTEYLDGICFFQSWVGKSSSEVRLVPTGGTKIYNHKWFEDICFEHNKYYRLMRYKHSVKAPGIDHCFDCWKEVFVFEQLLRRMGVQPTTDDIAKKSMELSESLTGNPKALETYFATKNLRLKSRQARA